MNVSAWKRRGEQGRNTESVHCNKNSARLKRETIIQPVHRCSYMCLRFGCGRAMVWPVHAGTWKPVQL